MTEVGGSVDRDLLAREFTDELYDDYRHLVRTINYRAKVYLELVTMHRGVGAAQILLHGPDTSDGFVRLWQERKLDHSLEARVIKPKYAVLFTDDELAIADRRLRQHGFDVDGYLAGLPDSDR